MCDNSPQVHFAESSVNASLRAFEGVAISGEVDEPSGFENAAYHSQLCAGTRPATENGNFTSQVPLVAHQSDSEHSEQEATQHVSAIRRDLLFEDEDMLGVSSDDSIAYSTDSEFIRNLSANGLRFESIDSSSSSSQESMSTFEFSGEATKALGTFGGCDFQLVFGSTSSPCISDLEDHTPSKRLNNNNQPEPVQTSYQTDDVLVVSYVDNSGDLAGRTNTSAASQPGSCSLSTHQSEPCFPSIFNLSAEKEKGLERRRDSRSRIPSSKRFSRKAEAEYTAEPRSQLLIEASPNHNHQETHYRDNLTLIHAHRHTSRSTESLLSNRAELSDLNANLQHAPITAENVAAHGVFSEAAHLNQQSDADTIAFKGQMSSRPKMEPKGFPPSPRLLKQAKHKLPIAVRSKKRRKNEFHASPRKVPSKLVKKGQVSKLPVPIATYSFSKQKPRTKQRNYTMFHTVNQTTNHKQYTQ